MKFVPPPRRKPTPFSIEYLTGDWCDVVPRRGSALSDSTLRHGVVPHPTGGWQQARKDRIQQRLSAEPHAWCPDQYTNPDNVDAYTGLAQELLFDLGQIDVRLERRRGRPGR